MGKTIIINDADFSDVSVGYVDIRQLSETAQTWISASGNTSLTDEQKFAIDDFIDAIGVNTVDGVYSKIDKLFLPMLAIDKSHALVDYKNNYITPTISTGSSSWENKVVFRNHGIVVFGEVQSSDYVPVISNDYSSDKQNSSFFVFNSESYQTIDSGSKNRSGIGATTTNMAYRKMQTTTKMRYYVFGTSYEVENIGNALAPHLTGCICTENNIKYLFADGTFVDATAAESGTTTGLGILGFNGDRLLDETDASKGAYIVGKAMTEAEVTTLKTAIETLFAAINV